MRIRQSVLRAVPTLALGACVLLLVLPAAWAAPGAPDVVVCEPLCDDTAQPPPDPTPPAGPDPAVTGAGATGGVQLPPDPTSDIRPVDVAPAEDAVASSASRGPETVAAAAQPAPSAAASVQSRPLLPFTGAPLDGLAGLGALLLAAGAAAYGAARRRPARRASPST